MLATNREPATRMPAKEPAGADDGQPIRSVPAQHVCQPACRPAQTELDRAQVTSSGNLYRQLGSLAQWQS